MELGSSRDLLLPVSISRLNVLTHFQQYNTNISGSRVKLYSVNTTKLATQKRLKQLEEHGASLLPITRPLPFDLQSDEDYLEDMKKRGGRDPEE